MTASCHHGLASETADRWAKASPPSSAAQARKRRIRRMRVLSSRQAKCIKSERWVRNTGMGVSRQSARWFLSRRPACRWLERPGFGGVVEDGDYGKGVAIVIEKAAAAPVPCHSGLPPENADATVAGCGPYHLIHGFEKTPLAFGSFRPRAALLLVLRRFPVPGRLHDDDVLPVTR